MNINKREDLDSSNEQYRKEENPLSSSGNQESEKMNDENIQAGKEKYIRDSANIEDVRGNGGEPVEENSKHLTDKSGEEKDEEYINTDERKKDLDETNRERGL